MPQHKGVERTASCGPASYLRALWVFTSRLPRSPSPWAWGVLCFTDRFARTGDVKWMDSHLVWVNMFALSFALGVLSSNLSFQFGTNGPGFTEAVGNVSGPLSVDEVMTAFFLEAVFFGRHAVRRAPGAAAVVIPRGAIVILEHAAQRVMPALRGFVAKAGTGMALLEWPWLSMVLAGRGPAWAARCGGPAPAVSAGHPRHSIFRLDRHAGGLAGDRGRVEP